jgi:starch synthase (maltosyl-transferring)
MNRWDGHFQRAAEMGFDWIFINPIQKTGSSGSLYSVSDYYGINPAFLDPCSKKAPDAQVRQMLAEAEARGLGVMTDLVINHCAIDAALTREHPEWFARGQDGGIAHPSCLEDGHTVVWNDLAQFDHEHTRDREGLYQYCLKLVRHYVDLGFTGFRCDAAYKLNPEFWRRLIRDIRAKSPGVCFAAETLGCTAEQTRSTAQAGFDVIFNSSKWWNYSDAWLLLSYELTRRVAPSISFPESHDTARLAEELQGNVEAIKQRYLFSALFSAGVMIPAGFEFGMRKALHVVNSRPEDWNESGPDLRAYIRKVNDIKRGNPVFLEEGPATVLPFQNPNILLLRKSSEKRGGEALLILNKDVSRHQEYYVDDLRQVLPSGGPLRDVSPEYPLEKLHQPFHYALRPGQGIVIVGPSP